MSSLMSQTISTLNHVLLFMASKMGGVVPSASSKQYALMVECVQHAQDQDAYRGMWRRCLQKVTGNITTSTTAEITLPDNFNKPNGIYSLFVGGVDWNEPDNEDERTLFVYQVMDYADADFGKWKVTVGSVSATTAYTLYYFGNPPVPSAITDKLILRGDMVAYGALQEYLIRTDDTDSLNDIRAEHENRFQEYLSLEMLPAKQELPEFRSYMGTRFNRTIQARDYYTARPNRYRQ